jgi:hypothetical protein
MTFGLLAAVDAAFRIDVWGSHSQSQRTSFMKLFFRGASGNKPPDSPGDFVILFLTGLKVEDALSRAELAEAAQVSEFLPDSYPAATSHIVANAFYLSVQDRVMIQPPQDWAAFDDAIQVPL